MPGPARLGKMDEIRDLALAQRSNSMSQLTKAFSVNQKGFSPGSGAPPLAWS